MNLKAYLANVGMTAKDFAHKLDISNRYLSHIMQGSMLPSRRLARDIEAATNGEVQIEFSLKTKKVREDEERIKKQKERQQQLEKQKSNQLDLFETKPSYASREMTLGMDLIVTQERSMHCQ